MAFGMQRQGQSQKAAPSIQEGNQKLEINPKFRKQTKCLKQEVGGGGGGAGRPKSGEKTRLLFFPLIIIPEPHLSGRGQIQFSSSTSCFSLCCTFWVSGFHIRNDFPGRHADGAARFFLRRLRKILKQQPPLLSLCFKARPAAANNNKKHSCPLSSRHVRPSLLHVGMLPNMLHFSRRQTMLPSRHTLHHSGQSADVKVKSF